MEVNLNNRPLGYIEDDYTQSILTPNKLIHGENIILPQEDVEVLDESQMQKRLLYINRCKDNAWKQWKEEYVRSLRERHNLKHKTTYLSPVPGEVVLIKGDLRNRGKWNIGIVETIMPSRDGVIRGVRLKTKNGYLERAVQHLYPLELRCDDESDDAKAKDNENENNLNVHTKEFRPRRS